MTKKQILHNLLIVKEVMELDPDQFYLYHWENIAQTNIPNDWYTLFELQKKYSMMYIQEILKYIQ